MKLTGKFKCIVVLAVVIVICLTLCACNETPNQQQPTTPNHQNPTIDIEEVAVSDVVLSSSTLTLKVGESQTLSAKIYPSNATDKRITWKSSNPSVASVNNGTVTALNNGTTTIMATSSNGKSAICSITVSKPYIPYTAMRISTTFLRINVGGTYTFTYSYAPSGASEKVVLKTQNSNLINVGEHGVITAKAVGETVVYLESQSGLRSECVVQIIGIQDNDNMTLNSRDNSPAGLTATAKLSNINFVFETSMSSSSTLQFIKYNITLTKTSYSVSNDPSKSATFVVNYKIYDPNNVIVKSGSLISPSFCLGETVMMTGSISINWNDSMPIGNYRIVLSGLS